MLSSVGLEVMNSTNPELNWKTVTKGRRSRKSMARSLNGVAKAGHCISPKRVGDFAGSDSDKFGEVVRGQSTSGKSENVPLKKRGHFRQSPSAHRRKPSSLRQDSVSPRRSSSLPIAGDHNQLQNPSSSSGQRSSNWQLRGFDGFAEVRFGEGQRNRTKYNDAGDFSGIELLAAAASMDDYDDNANKEDLVVADSLVPKIFDVSTSVTQSDLGFKSNESENSSSHMTVCGGNTDCLVVLNNSTTGSQSLCGSREDETMPKVSRHLWDLNTPMDAWGEPDDDPIGGNNAVDVNDNMHHGHSNSGGRGNESSNLEVEENKLSAVTPDIICSKSSALEVHLLESSNCCYPNAVRVISDRADEKDADEKNANEVLNFDAHMKTSNQVLNTGDISDSSPFSKPCCSSGLLMPEEEINTLSGTVAIIQNANCSINVSQCERTTAADRMQTMTLDVTAHDMPSSEISEFAKEILRKDTEDFPETSETPGIQNGEPILIAGSETYISDSTMIGYKGHSKQAELLANPEDNCSPNEESKRNMMEDSCKSCSTGARSEPATSFGRIGLVTRDSGVSKDNHDMVDGVDLTRFEERGYDSPYEDGELRGSFLYSWEDNELENECVDYESDGRNGDGSDAGDLPGSETVENGCEDSHNISRISLLAKRFPDAKTKSGPAKLSSSQNISKDDSDNNEIAGNGSNAGSGTTVEQSMEVVVEENGDDMKSRQLIDGRDAVDVKVNRIDGYASKMARGKLQSRIEGQSSMDATEGRDIFFLQQCRSRRLAGTYSRSERETSPDKYLGRYNRPTATHGERDGVQQWTSFGLRKRYNSSYQGHSHSKPRIKTGDSAEKTGGMEFHDQRQTANSFSIGLHRPLMRRPPVERDDYLGMGRRMPLTRGVSKYRSRGHYSERAGRDFSDDFIGPPPDDAGTSAARIPRYLSRRDQSFSPPPTSRRGAHNNTYIPRRRSHSRSRTRSPRSWHPHREQFRSEARMERLRVPFPKPNFASSTNDYGEGNNNISPPPRGRFSSPSQRNGRWVDDQRHFHDNQMRRRRSPPPVRVFRRPQKLDENGRLKSGEYFRPMNRPTGRFPFMANGGGGGREGKLEPSGSDRRRDDSGDMVHRGLRSDDGANVRRFRFNDNNNNAPAASAADGDDLETSNLNNEW